LTLTDVNTDSNGRFLTLLYPEENSGFSLGKHILTIHYGGTTYLRSTNKTTSLEILADITEITITVTPTKQIVGGWIWVNTTKIETGTGPAPSGTFTINIVRLETGFKFTETVELNGTDSFSKQILLASDLAPGQYVVYVRYSHIETSNSITMTVVGLTDFIMDNVKVHRGDPPVLITATLIDNTRSGLSSAPVSVEFEDEMLSLITDNAGKIRFNFEAKTDHALGIVPVTFTYDGDDEGALQYIGVNTARNIVVSSPTTIILDEYPKFLNRSQDIQIAGKIIDDQGKGVSNANIFIYISHIYLHEFSTDENGKFSVNKLLTKSIMIGVRTLELEFVGDDKYENSSTSELVTIYDEPWISLRAVGDLKKGELYSVVIELRDPNGIEPLANELLEIKVDGELLPIYRTNNSGKVIFSRTFPEDSNEVTLVVIFNGDLSHYLLPTETTYELSVPGPSVSSQFMGNMQAFWILILGFCLIVFVLFIWSRWRRRHIKEIQEIITELAEELETTDEIRKVIYNAYIRMLEVLKNYGFLRRKSDTPREFAQAVRKAMPEIDRKHLHKLTSLFEEARYSDHELTKHERFKAIRSLRRVKASLDKVPPPSTTDSIKKLWFRRRETEA
jgi:hypothetical protein